jgi:predicted SnoaL-like aldol condensation-catalyzing enzyme
MTKIKNMNNSASTINKSLDRKQIARQFLEMVIAGKIDEAYEKFISPTGKHHYPFFREGFPALREAMKENHLQFPDKHLIIKNVICEDDRVAVHSHIILSPNEADMAVVHLFRFNEDKIVEFWDIGQTVPAGSQNKDGMF